MPFRFTDDKMFFIPTSSVTYTTESVGGIKLPETASAIFSIGYNKQTNSALFSGSVEFNTNPTNTNYRIVETSNTVKTSDSYIEITAVQTTQSLYTAVGNLGKVITFVNEGSGTAQILAFESETIGNSHQSNPTFITLNSAATTILVSNDISWRIIV